MASRASWARSRADALASRRMRRTRPRSTRTPKSGSRAERTRTGPPTTTRIAGRITSRPVSEAEAECGHRGGAEGLHPGEVEDALQHDREPPDPSAIEPVQRSRRGRPRRAEPDTPPLEDDAQEVPEARARSEAHTLRRVDDERRAHLSAPLRALTVSGHGLRARRARGTSHGRGPSARLESCRSRREGDPCPGSGGATPGEGPERLVEGWNPGAEG